MAHLVTGYKGEEHIKSSDDGSFNASFFGSGQYVMEAGNQMSASIMDNNTVRVKDGDLLMHGRHIRIENSYENVTIETGTAGTKRYDLIVMTYEKNASTGKEEARLEVIKGTASASPTVPSYTSGNILEGARKNQMPLYKVYIEGVVLKSIECLFTTIPTYKTLAEQAEAEFIQACTTHLNSLNVLDTEEAIMSCTSSNQLAGAVGVKEVLNNVKKSVGDGKELVANAITAKGVATATDATFATMATNISNIFVPDVNHLSVHGKGFSVSKNTSAMSSLYFNASGRGVVLYIIRESKDVYFQLRYGSSTGTVVYTMPSGVYEATAILDIEYSSGQNLYIEATNHDTTYARQVSCSMAYFK